MSKFLLILDGMTGAGKTTTSTLLSKHIPRVAVIGMDKIKWFISDFERCQRDNAITRDIVFEMARKYLEHGISVILEQPLNDDELKQYEELAQQNMVPIYKFQLFTTPELAFERVINRQKDRENKVPEDRILRNISLFENKSNRGFTVIDTSSISSEEVTMKILREIMV